MVRIITVFRVITVCKNMFISEFDGHMYGQPACGIAGSAVCLRIK